MEIVNTGSKSKDIGNIKEGCLYFVGVNYKSGSIHR